MDVRTALQQKEVIDIVTVDGSSYAITTEPITLPGFLAVPVGQLHNHLRLFLTKGYSQRHKQPYATATNLTPIVIYTYDVSSLQLSRKQSFSHALRGTGGRPGLLRTWGGKALGRGSFAIPHDRASDADAFFSTWRVPHTTEVMLRA